MKKKHKGFYPKPTTAQLIFRYVVLFLLMLCILETFTCYWFISSSNETATYPGDPKYDPEHEGDGVIEFFAALLCLPFVAVIALPITFLANRFYMWLGEQLRIVEPDNVNVGTDWNSQDEQS